MSDQTTTTPGYRQHYNVNPAIKAHNSLDGDNPTSGTVRLDLDFQGDEQPDFPALYIRWQSKPRAQEGSDELLPPNGAFVEDVLWAALQRLEFFNEGKYRCRENSLAITKIEEALFILKDRQLSRSDRGVEGKHEV